METTPNFLLSKRSYTVAIWNWRACNSVEKNRRQLDNQGQDAQQPQCGNQPSDIRRIVSMGNWNELYKKGQSGSYK